MANRFIGEVDAPEFGDGFTIRLDAAGQAIIETADGSKPAQIGQALFDMQNGLAFVSVSYINKFLAVALRKSDVVVDKVPDLPAPLAPLAQRCLDAFTLFRYGKMHDEWVAEEAAKAVEPKKAVPPNPTKGTKA